MSTKVAGSPARVLARLSRIVENALGEDDLSLPQYRLLAFLSQGDAAASALADRLDVSRPSLTAIVDGLVKRGLVERRHGVDDRRRVDHVLTSEGKRVLRAADDRADAAIRTVFADLDADVASGAHVALCRLHEAMDARLQEKQVTALSDAELDLVREDERDPGPSPFEPMGVSPRYTPPKGRISGDRDKGWIKRMLPIVLAHKWLFGTSLFLAFIALAAQVAVPRVLGKGIDAIAEGDTLTPIVVTLLVLGFVRSILTFLYRYGLYKVAYKIEFDLRSIMFEHLSRMSFSFYDKQQTGQLISRANSDIRSVQMLLAFAPFMAMTLITFFAGFAVMVTIHVGLTLVAIAVLPGVYVLGVKMRNIMFPISWIVQGRQAEVATIVEENVAGVRVVKSFAAEEQEIRKLARAANRLRWATITTIDNRARYGPAMENLPRLGMALVLLYGGWLAIEGEVTVGDIVVFNQYVIMLQAPFRMLGFFMMMSQRAAASAQRIFDDTEPEVADHPGSVDLVECEGGIEFDGVRFGYGDGPDVLKDLSFRIEPGETVALVGRTGTAKTTVARLLDRFYDVRDGAIRIDGTDVRDLTLASLRHHVGMVTEEPFLFSATVRENIAYGRPDAPLDAIVTAAKAAGAHDFIEALEHGYDTLVGERGYTLSGGQRQRIAIARALLADPKILVLDDATSAIDVRVEAQIHDALRSVMRGRTTIVIAHRLSTIHLADRVLLLEGGKVVADGSHADLMASEPRYVEVLATVEEHVHKEAPIEVPKIPVGAIGGPGADMPGGGA